MNIQSTLDRLTGYRKDADKTRQDYHSQVEKNTQTMQPEYSKQRNDLLREEAQKRLSRLSEDAQSEVNQAQTKFEKAIDTFSITASLMQTWLPNWISSQRLI